MADHRLTFHPTDVLFFRDGRPMEGASSGHGAAWPLPHVLNAAIHNALHRAELDDVHHHRVGRSSDRSEGAERSRAFGSLQTAGPFPIDAGGRWYFPRPADAARGGSSETTHRPLLHPPAGCASSLPSPLRPVVAAGPPTKDAAEPWLDGAAYEAYLSGAASPETGDTPSGDGASANESRTSASEEEPGPYCRDDRIFAAEHRIGIGIDPETGTQDGERFYSASYLRLRKEFGLGLVARCRDKGPNGRTADRDLIDAVFPNSGHRTRVVAGGRQRTCTVLRETGDAKEPLPLPTGAAIEGCRVRWTLLTPAIFPEIPADSARGIQGHPGGWLPTWIAAGEQTLDGESRAFGDVLLRDGPGPRKAARIPGLTPGRRIPARLVAALVPRAIPVTGWSLAADADETGGARATHLAVPAGAVYYFEADGTDEAEKQSNARKLAVALNWHGDGTGDEIRNRRSTLMGEKGFGVGVCSPWNAEEST